MADEIKASDSTDEAPTSLTFDYIKSQLFRIVHADGALGGAGPRENIQINFFSERLPIPQREVYLITQDQKLGPEVTEQRVARAGIVREVEVGVVMELSVAKGLLRWLTTAVESADRLRKQRRDKEKEIKNGS